MNEQPLNEREMQRAQKLAENGNVRRVGDKFLVRDSHFSHTVWRDESGKIMCDCSDFKAGFAERPNYRCRGIIAVKYALLAKNTEPIVDEKHKSIYEKVGYQMGSEGETQLLKFTDTEGNETFMQGKTKLLDFKPNAETVLKNADEAENLLTKTSQTYNIDLKLKLPFWLWEKPKKVMLEKLKETSETRLTAEYAGGIIIITGEAKYESSETGDIIKIDCIFKNISDWKAIEK